MSGNDERVIREENRERYTPIDIPPPPELINAKVWLECRKRLATNPDLIRVIEHFIQQVDQYLAAFWRVQTIVW